MPEHTYQYSYIRSDDQDTDTPARHKVVIVGAGPVGMTLALDLAQRGVPVVLLDDNNRIGEGSRAICFSKRTLEIFDRLGVADWQVQKGVTWNLGRLFWRDAEVYSFDLLPEPGHKMPAFINLQQYYVEAHLAAACARNELVDLRWKNRVTDIRNETDGVDVAIDTPDGPYRLHADYLVAADGAKSSLRDMLGIAFRGQVFEDRFLIADVRMSADFPSERWFWFEPPFHNGQSALLHKQPDNVWRIDLQLGWDADPQVEAQPDRVRPRLEKMLGGREFELEWVSVYTFQCRRIEQFVHGRTIFAGDSAHQVSPFGARGANSGIQDAENLAWKLERVLAGRSPASLVDSYHNERSQAADENIGHSTRSTDFIAPANDAALLFRNAVLELASRAPFARTMVNSGRLSTPCVYETDLTTPDEDGFGGRASLGGVVPDAPLQDPDGGPVWLLNQLGPGFTLIVTDEHDTGGLDPDIAVLRIGTRYLDADSLFAERFDATPGTCYLVRPDQHLCARWRHYDAGRINAALRKATGQSDE